MVFMYERYRIQPGDCVCMNVRFFLLMVLLLFTSAQAGAQT